MTLLAAHKAFNTIEGDPWINLPALLIVVGVFWYLGKLWNKNS